MPTITRTRSVLVRIPPEPGSLRPGRKPDVIDYGAHVDGRVDRLLSLTAKAVRDLGDPETITVTIEPGNTLKTTAAG